MNKSHKPYTETLHREFSFLSFAKSLLQYSLLTEVPQM